MNFNHEKLWRQIRHKKNVMAYCPVRAREIRNGREHNAWAFRVYVYPKVTNPKEIEKLRESGDLLPEIISGLPVDVVDFMDYLRKIDIVTDKRLIARTYKKKSLNSES